MNPQSSTNGSMQVESSPIYNYTSSTDDSDFERKLPERMKSNTKKKHKHVKLPSVALLCDRTAVSDRTVACVSSAVL